MGQDSRKLDVGVITLFPEMFNALSHGINKRAIEQGIVNVSLFNPRDYTQDKHRNVDDRPYGGGPGMVMMVQPLVDAITAAKAQLGNNCKTIYLSPQGRRVDQAGIVELSKQRNLLLIAGRYEGIDERVIQTHIDEEWSLGDFVLSGGEIAALAFIDAMIRLEPDALGHIESAQQESFTTGLLDHPHYTRPENISGLAVPSVLLCGDHAAISRWRLKQALGKTWLRRPDLFEKRPLTSDEQQLLQEFKEEQST